MYFIINNDKKIIFGWSAKCGCSHIKRIFWNLDNDNINNEPHIKIEEMNKLPDNTNEYDIILFVRNPYKRIVSGFLDKYKKDGSFRKMWKSEKLTFSLFVDEIISENWDVIEKHHFIQQTSENFDENKILQAKSYRIFDIENIDYSYIEMLYNKTINNDVLHIKQGHERKTYENTIHYDVYDLEMEDYYENNINYKYFYNSEIKNKIYKFYENDFTFFIKNGFNFDI
jgi:hypothetical protein